MRVTLLEPARAGSPLVNPIWHCGVLEMHLGGDRGAVARGGRELAQGNLTRATPSYLTLTQAMATRAGDGADP